MGPNPRNLSNFGLGLQVKGQVIWHHRAIVLRRVPVVRDESPGWNGLDFFVSGPPCPDFLDFENSGGWIGTRWNRHFQGAKAYLPSSPGVNLSKPVTHGEFFLPSLENPL